MFLPNECPGLCKKIKLHEMKNGKRNFRFFIYKIWQILKRFTGTFRRAQTLKLGGVQGLVVVQNDMS